MGAQQPLTPSVRPWNRRTFLWRAGATLVGGIGLAACTAPAATPTAVPGAKPTTAPASGAAAAAAPAANTGAPTGTLRYASADFAAESMDPRTAAIQWPWVLYDTLLTFDNQGNAAGRVAESYNLGPDGLTWTFNIRKDIKFHNGEPLTAQDVVFSLQYFGGKEATSAWSRYILGNNESIVAKDDYTVVYKTVKPEWTLKIPFTQTHILPKKYFESLGQAGFFAKPVGSGPYKLVKLTNKQSVEFEANTDYWGHAKPQWSRIVESLVPEESTRIAQLERGDVDMIGNLSFDRYLELKKKGYRLQ